MNQQLSRTRAQISAEFVELDERYTALYRRCSREQLLWRPRDGSWSIAECIEHVSLSVATYLVPIRAAISRGGPPAPTEDYLFVPGGWFSSAFLKRIGPQVTLKMKAPGKIRPISVDPDRAFHGLCDEHREVQKLLTDTSHLDLSRMCFRNPLIPALRFTVATGFLVLAAHGRRHLQQSERVTQREGFSIATAQQNV